ncbi:aminoglycoside phosphotransferase family protein [Gammaproteobacteria bacterium]|nr:aminoglycoside phosphotransferase family protein [Gammaproteobacteria bacterium]
MSLYFFDQRLRIKSLVEKSLRSHVNMVNEYTVRTNMSLNLKTKNFSPPLKSKLYISPAYYFLDELVPGRTLNWKDGNSQKIMMKALINMFVFYREQGLFWTALDDLDLDLLGLQNWLFEHSTPDFRKRHRIDILELKNFKVLTAQIHGDFSPGNILVTADQSYIIDWELSERAPLVNDFYRLYRKSEVFREKLDHFVEAERQSDSTDINRFLPLDSQIQIFEYVRSTGNKIIRLRGQ